MRHGLRDPLGLDGSPRPSDRESRQQAFRMRLRRLQPGLAFWLDLRDWLRSRRQPASKA